MKQKSPYKLAQRTQSAKRRVMEEILESCPTNSTAARKKVKGDGGVTWWQDISGLSLVYSVASC